MLELAEYLRKVGQEMHLKCDVAWLLVWIGISSAGRNRLPKIKNEVDNITKTATSVKKLRLLTFYCTPANPVIARPQIVIV